MKSRSANRLWKKCAAILCVVCGVLAFWSSAMLCTHWDDLWSAGNFYQSGSLYQAKSLLERDVTRGMELRLHQSWGGQLDYLEQFQLEQIEKRLGPAATNYRFRVRLDNGTILWSNLEAGESMDSLEGQETGSFHVSEGRQDYYQDDARWDSTDTYTILQVWTGETYVEFDPMVLEDLTAARQYGYSYDRESDSWHWNSGQDGRIHTADLVLESAVTNPLTAEDVLWAAKEDYDAIQTWLIPAALICLLSISGTLALLTALLRAAARRPGEDEGFVLSWQDKIPYDLYLAGAAALACIPIAAGDPISVNINQYGLTVQSVVGLGVLSAAEGALALTVLMSTVRRLRARILLRETLCWRICAGIVGLVRQAAAHWPMTRRVVWLFLLYLLGTVLTGLTIILIPVYQGFVLWVLCRWVRQWRTIRDATGEIVGGKPETHIDTDGMYRDLREHAEQLNDLGSSISQAVEERLKSERFKAELITNVSHDLKTPLTSIINYVDLLKKVELSEPKALEYIEVLDRKSQRLKKLTEDLVEASKASTGTLPVALERLDFGQLVQQAMGEYEEKFLQAALTPVLSLGTGPLDILADGRHLWRVIDNLLGNCCKYALGGTRVYLDLTLWEGRVILTVKNISRDPLNVPPEQLMERFVRGDAARSSEGSGLGLSIARSLTELQGGSFRLDVDGDLFKAAVSLPAAPEEALALHAGSGEPPREMPLSPVPEET